MTHCRPRIGRARRRFSGIFPTLTMNLVKVLGLRVVRLELVVGDGPGGRDAAVMLHLAEVLMDTSLKEALENKKLSEIT